jgi:hypothetical protein
MESSLDTFRAQREAVDQVHARLAEVSQLLNQVQSQVDAVAGNTELRAMLRDEQNWLREAQRLLSSVRYFREQERLRFWPGVWRRWVLALAFSLASAGAAGAGYALVVRSNAAELAELRVRAGVADVIAKRTMSMSAAERRQFDALMKPPTAVR